MPSGLFVHGSMGVDLRHAFNTVSANGCLEYLLHAELIHATMTAIVAFSLPFASGGVWLRLADGPYTDQRMMSLFVDRSSCPA